ncbi:MAG: phosphoglycerate dehydrogenase [Deltaproteobacteria bacterium]|jgi:D-3-phosphoglycerate dehydrogenase|nr:phosphoglycerate dehydrogenase [Deltaproteobacteria bacterium]MBW2476488.1 phosphoglycerate dehydrogenase [Deltaproteobacteria bacterium]MBW2503820.1 phosphoglycerate dehydrogenase [Deltaproteobacteria bacterium]
MYKIRTYNKISVRGLEKFSRDKYEVASELGHPDAIMLRSHQLKPDDIEATVKSIGRAGAGVNNIPVESCTERGIVVFNAPGANANAVKELALAAMLLSARDIFGAIEFIRREGPGKNAEDLHTLVEGGKKAYGGTELKGKTLGVVGLGAIGSQVAETGLLLGMNVLGYDPALSVEAAWRLSRDVARMDNMQSLLAKSDIVTLHLPVLEATRNLINKELIDSFKDGAVLINLSREKVVDTEAIMLGLNKGKVGKYITDFPVVELIGHANVVAIPHLGASTEEAEENCAVMVAEQLTDFLENGNIKNSVNFPNISLERTAGYRIAFSNRNVPKMLNQVLSVLADRDINVIDMINKSREEVAYNIIDIETEPTDELIEALEAIDGVIKVRTM